MTSLATLPASASTAKASSLSVSFSAGMRDHSVSAANTSKSTNSMSANGGV